MDLKGRWLWFMLTLMKVISSQQLCPHHCLQCDLNMRCLKCVDGYYGVHCNMPCDPVCRNGKCRIDGSCHDIIERAVWKIRRMRRNTGVNCYDAKCTCCKSNYSGSNCQVPCPNCRTRYDSGVCNRYCETGFYGDTCEENCPRNCAPGNAGKPLCKKATGECSNNCKPGFFMKMCNTTCPKDCKDGICLPISGSCVECNGISYGVECKEKCHGCEKGCYRNGTCVQGCAAGYHGELCNRRCGTDCSEGGRCRLYTEQQKKICMTKCEYIPASPNVIEECVASASSAETIAPEIVAPVVITIIIIVIVILVIILWRKKCCCFSTPGEETTGEAGGAANEPFLESTPGAETMGDAVEAAIEPSLERMPDGEPMEERNDNPNDTHNKDRLGADEPMEKRNDKPNYTPGKDRMPTDEPAEKTNVKPNDTPKKGSVQAMRQIYESKA